MLIFSALMTYSSSAAVADELGPINAERPGFSSSPIALGPSLLQVESGYQFEHDGGSATPDQSTFPLALVRIGLVENIELQLFWAGITWSDIDGSNTHGANDASVGVKWQLTDQDATVPVAVFAGLSLPVGDNGLSSDEYDPSLGVFWSYSGGLDWFGTMLLSASDGETTIDNAVGLSFAIEDNSSAFLEYVGSFTGDNGPEHYLNGGYAYLPQNNMQLDVNFGLALNDRATDFSLGFGIAYRF